MFCESFGDQLYKADMVSYVHDEVRRFESYDCFLQSVFVPRCTTADQDTRKAVSIQFWKLDCCVKRDHISTLMASAGTSKTPLVFGCGNPLLDIQVHTDQSFWDKYGLLPGGFTFQSEKQKDIYDVMQKHEEVRYIPGGATLNTMRICQGLLEEPNSVFYTGCVADDDLAHRMEDLCKKEGLLTQFTRSPDNPTGVCGVSIVDGERSLCTRLGAANDFKIESLSTPKARAAFQNAKIVYSAGFFLTVCSDGMLQTAQECAKLGKIFCSSLSANFLVEFFKDQMTALLPYVDVLFGNHMEFAHFAHVHGFKEGMSLPDIALEIARWPKANPQRPRIVVITQGKDHTIVASSWRSFQQFKVTMYPVELVPQKEIVDVNAAGDAFVGGFLYGAVRSLEYSDDLDLDMCLHFANMAGGHVIRQFGCRFSFTDKDRSYPL